MVYLSNGRLLSVDYLGHLYVSTSSGEQQFVTYPGSAVNAMGMDRGGTELVTAESDQTVDLWRAVGTTYTQIRLPSPIDLTTGPAQDVEMTPDGSRILIVTSDDYTIQVRNAHTGQQLLTPLSATNAVYLGAFSPECGPDRVGDYNGQVEVWDAAGGYHWVLGTGRSIHQRH